MKHLIQRLLQQPILLATLLLSLVAIGIIGFLNLRGLGNLEPPPPVAPSQTSSTPPATVVTKPHSPPVAPTTVSNPQDELATPTTQLTQFQWQLGARQTYRYQLQTDLKVDMTATLKTNNNTQPQWQQINSQLSGILNLRVFGTQHDRVQLGVQLSNVELN